MAREPRGVTVNDSLQSVSNPAVYAAGDAAASGPPLTPTAAHEGEVVAANLLHGNHRRPNYAGLASVAFTVPALATVGLTEEAARTQGRRFQTQYQDTSSCPSPLRIMLRDLFTWFSGHRNYPQRPGTRPFRHTLY